MKNIIGVYSAPHQHWVGNGFPVRSLFSYHSHGQSISPFLLLDRAGPTQFPPALEPRGVGQHPHRGFETVTIVYSGEVAHKDSTGQGGVIGPGDVQWMTAASGILHEEFHSEAFNRAGGVLDMVQLWVNLPAKSKMSAPRYQAISDSAIPSVRLPDGIGQLRVIAGAYGGQVGPAQTFSPMNVWDLRLQAGAKLTLPAAEGWNTAVVILHGSVRINEQVVTNEAQLALLERSGNDLIIEAYNDSVVLLLSGEPIDEPIAGHGPFVMNTEQEIANAISDFENGRFGQVHK